MIDSKLLRRCRKSLQEVADALQRAADRPRLRVIAGDGQSGLVAVLGLAADPVEQQRPTGRRLRMPFGDGQPGEQTPPVVDQGHDARQDLTAPLILGRETSPSPLILQFIEYVLRLRPIPVELRDSQHRFFQRRDQYGVLV